MKIKKLHNKNFETFNILSYQFIDDNGNLIPLTDVEFKDICIVKRNRITPVMKDDIQVVYAKKTFRVTLMGKSYSIGYGKFTVTFKFREKGSNKWLRYYDHLFNDIEPPKPPKKRGRRK